MEVGAPAKQERGSVVVRNMARRPRTATSPLVCGPVVTALPKYSGEPRRRREEHVRGVPWLPWWHKTSVLPSLIGNMLTPRNATMALCHVAEGFCVTSARHHSC